MTRLAPLPPEQLRRYTSAASLGFACTDEVSPKDELVGQARAEEAMELSLGIANDGYNTYVMGSSGAGKHNFVRRLLERRGRERETPDDLCYVNNFVDASRPRALRVPKGRGRALRSDMQALVDALRVAIRAAFDSDDYRGRRQVLEHQVQERHESALEDIQKQAKQRSLAFMRTPMGFAFAPTLDGEIVSPEVFSKLAPEEQERFKASISDMEHKLQSVLSQLPRVQREVLERINALSREVTEFAVQPLFEDLLKRYADLPAVSDWLAAVQKEVSEHAELFLSDEQGQQQAAIAMALGEAQPSRAAYRRYAVNLFVDRADAEGAPVVYEDHPTLENLVGRVEHRAHLGTLTTDFTLILPGALHRANGGCLVLDAQKLLVQPQSYEALKRALRSKQVRIESLAETLGLSSAGRLDPEPVPLSLKVVLVGDRRLYYLLSAYDPEFDQLFKVAADFEDDIARTEQSERDLSRLIGTIVQREKLCSFECAAVARVIDEAARWAEDSGRLSLQTQAMVDLLRETDFMARKHGHERALAEDVSRAVEAQIRRADRVRQHSLRMLEEGTILLSTRGDAVGQINGLSVLMFGNVAFGRPTRITCRVRLGRGEVLDIEREVKLGGPIHTKGVLILSGFLGARYAKERALSLSASLVFEQSYGGVDGDSASLAEACALLSAIAEVPLGQRFALTGSINQMGEVQPIGGVNEKIEGFYDACKAQGLSGDQAVIIPHSNVRHLMLREDVIAAVREGKLTVYPVSRVDEALELLTGMPISELDARVSASLDAFAERAKTLSQGTLIERRVEVQGAPSDGAPPPPLPAGEKRSVDG